MKKLLSLLIAVVSMFAFSGCLRFEDSFVASQAVEQVAYIKVYYVEEAQTELERFPEPMETLEETEFEALIQDIEELTYEITMLLIAPAPSPNFAYDGYVVEIKYKDGGYDLVSSELRDSFFASGEFIKRMVGTHCDREIWISTLQKYVEISEE